MSTTSKFLVEAPFLSIFSQLVLERRTWDSGLFNDGCGDRFFIHYRSCIGRAVALEVLFGIAFVGNLMKISNSQPSEQDSGRDADKIGNVHLDEKFLGRRAILFQNKAELPMKIGNPDN